MYSIFVNYRRGAHSVSVAALAERLTHHFGVGEVFIDVDMPSGEKYPQEIEQRLRGCDVLVSVIHDGWAATFEEPRRKDWVHHEIATALEEHIAVIPVVLEDATPPEWDELPREIAEITLIQNAPLRARELRLDVQNLIGRIEQHIDPDKDKPPRPPVTHKPARVGLKTTAATILLTIVMLALFHEPGPLWRVLAFSAFASTGLFLVLAVGMVTVTWPLRRLGARWERRAGILSHREEISRNWLVPALALVFSAFWLSRFLTKSDGWQEGKVWSLIVVVLIVAFYFHRCWVRASATDHVWPPPVTSDHAVSRRAALRLHERLTTDPTWRSPRARTAQRQAVSIYFDLAEVRNSMVSRCTLPLTHWVRRGYDGPVTFYLGWFTSIVLLDISSLTALVVAEPMPGSPLLIIAVTITGAVVATAATVVTHFLFDRYRVVRWVDELTGWQGRLGPLIFCGGAPAHEHTLG